MLLLLKNSYSSNEQNDIFYLSSQIQELKQNRNVTSTTARVSLCLSLPPPPPRRVLQTP